MIVHYRTFNDISHTECLLTCLQWVCRQQTQSSAFPAIMCCHDERTGCQCKV